METSLTAKINMRISCLTELDNTETISHAIDTMTSALTSGNKIFIFGNGGSASQASHFAAELVNRFYFDRKAAAALALTDNMSNLTSIANDSDFKYIFSRQIEALGKENDVSIGISTSGTSGNVVEALHVSNRMGMKTIALCGNNPVTLNDIPVNIVIPVNSTDTPVIQEMHLFILHFFAEILEQRLYGNTTSG